MRRSAWFLTLILGLTLALIIPRFAPGKGEVDFVDYWTGSKLFISGQNPYDTDARKALHLEVLPSEGLNESGIAEVWNPPWLLLIMSPVALFPFNTAVAVWIFLNVLFVIMSINITWRLANQDPYQVNFLYAIAIVFLYGNTISLIRLGQISSLVLVSLLLGIWLIQKENDLFAGMFLSLTTIKPHLVYLALPVILLWVVKEKRYKVIVGFFIPLLISMMIAWLVFPNWLQSYIISLSNLPYNDYSTSTFGAFIASIFKINGFRFIGVLLIPAVLPLVKMIKPSQFLTPINLALAISLPFAPYGFSFDHILLIPAFLQILAWIMDREFSLLVSTIIGVGLILIFSFLIWLMTIPSILYSWFFWVAFALMIIYLYSWRNKIGYHSRS